MLLSMADLSIASELAATPKDLETVHFILLPGESGGGEGEGGGGDGGGGEGCGADGGCVGEGGGGDGGGGDGAENCKCSTTTLVSEVTVNPRAEEKSATLLLFNVATRVVG